MFDMKKRFLNCLNITWVPMGARVVATLFHILWCYLFTEIFEFQIWGLGAATFITDLTLVFVIEIFSLLVPIVNDTQVSLDESAIKGWCEYIKLGSSAALSLCATMWTFELLIFLSGSIGVRE